MFDTISVPASPHPSLLAFLPRVLSGTSDLTLSCSGPSLARLLAFTSPRLIFLDLSFSDITDEILSTMADRGALAHIKVLKLKGCKGIDDAAWLAKRLPKVERLDLSWSGIVNLPITSQLTEEVETSVVASFAPSSTPSVDSGFFDIFRTGENLPSFPSIIELSLSSCPNLSFSIISEFISALPSTLQILDLSHLSLSYKDLTNLAQRGCDPCLGASSRTALTRVNLRGNYSLNRTCIRGLQRLWREVDIVNEALLESDDEDSVRKFVQLFSGP